MIVPAAVVHRAELDSAVENVARTLAPDLVRIRYDLAEDWSGDLAIFFRVLLSDDASSRERLHEAATRVREQLERHVDFQELGVFPYHNFRGAAEQAVLRDAAWE